MIIGFAELICAKIFTPFHFPLGIYTLLLTDDKTEAQKGKTATQGGTQYQRQPVKLDLSDAKYLALAINTTLPP